jgi:hypothetical protein
MRRMQLTNGKARLRQAAAGIAMLALTMGLAACGDDSTGPTVDTQLVTGTWNLATLTFDPQGSLPEIDIRSRLNTNVQMIMAAAGAVQIVYQDPSSGLFTTIAGNYRTTASGVRIDFTSGTGFPSLLLSRRTDLAYDSIAKTLSFEGASPDGISRQRLIQLAPEFANEQLLDPTPGTLKVLFNR